MSDNITKTAAKLGHIGYELPATAALCQQALVKVTRQLKATIKEEIETKHLQWQHQDKRINNHKATGNTKVSKKIRGMQHAEAVKKIFQRCRAARNLGTEGGITHVLVPQNPANEPRS